MTFLGGGGVKGKEASVLLSYTISLTLYFTIQQTCIMTSKNKEDHLKIMNLLSDP